MKMEHLADKLYEHQFAAAASQRYHGARISAIKQLAGVLSAVELIAGTSALISTFCWSLSITRAVIFVAVLSSGLAWLQGAAKAIAFHYAQNAAWAELLALFPADLTTGTVETLAQVERLRATIEAADDRGFHCLDVLAHNEECQARGEHAHMRPLSWMQRHIGTWLLPLSYTETLKVSGGSPSAPSDCSQIQ